MARRDAGSLLFSTHLRVIVGLIAILFMLLAISTPSNAGPQDKKQPPAKDAPAKKDATPPDKAEPKQPAAPKLGLSINEPRAYQGYTLIAPMDSTKTYLIDMQGRVVHTWDSDCTPALCPYFLENGHLLRAGSIGPDSRLFGPGPGVGGKVQEFDWNGELVWDYRFYNARQLPHHDIHRMPNGHILLVVSDRKTNEEIVAAGRRPELAGDSHSIPDSIIEIKPTGKTTGEVVWEWHVWDHMVQDYDKTKANYGEVAKHPELIHINFGEPEETLKSAPDKASADKAKPAPDKVGQDKAKPKTPAPPNPPPAQPRRGNPDWTHFNAVAYNADLDQIVVSVYSFSEFWIIDHSTTKAEAASHKGGRSGKGGDLLYRWGNPKAYRQGKKPDQTLFNQHNVHWIPKGLPGEGHLMLFNNGNGRVDGSYSSVDELILPPVDAQGCYPCKPGGTFMPPQVAWSYSAPKKQDFYSSFISGTHRLPNGDTFICSGANGTVFEVTPSKEIVWKYVNPVRGGPQSANPGIQAGTLLAPVARDMLDVSTDQRKELDALQKKVDGQLHKLLTDKQHKQLTEKPQAPFSKPGEILASAEQSRLSLTDDQKKQLAALQKEVDDRFDKVLTVAQKKQLKGTQGPGGPAAAVITQVGGVVSQVANLFTGKTTTPAVPVPGGPSQAGKILSPGQQDFLKLTPEQRKTLAEMQKEIDAKMENLLTPEQRAQLKQMQPAAAPPGPVVVRSPGSGPQGGAPLFRACRIGKDHPGLAGKKLVPGKTIEELQKTPEKKEIARKVS